MFRIPTVKILKQGEYDNKDILEEEEVIKILKMVDQVLQPKAPLAGSIQTTSLVNFRNRTKLNHFY